MLKFSDYIAYHEYLAIQHKSINHRANDKHFFRFELEDVFTTLSDDVKFPAYILEGYDFDFKDSLSDNVMKGRNGAFMILFYCGDETKYSLINTLYQQAEEIGDDIVTRMIADKRNRNVEVIRDFDISATQGKMIANASKGYYGMRYEISLKSAFSNDVDINKWSDGGQSE